MLAHQLGSRCLPRAPTEAMEGVRSRTRDSRLRSLALFSASRHVTAASGASVQAVEAKRWSAGGRPLECGNIDLLHFEERLGYPFDASLVAAA
jgi:hypothetical protein